MDPTWVVVRNAFHTITKKKKKRKSEGAFTQSWRKEPIALFKRLVSVASDETITTYNKETHTTLNCMPDQGYRTEDVPRTSSDSTTSAVILITSCSRFTDVFSRFVGVFVFLKRFVSTLNHNLAWNIAQQLFTELQNKQSDWSTHNISHCPVCIFSGPLQKETYYKV